MTVHDSEIVHDSTLSESGLLSRRSTCSAIGILYIYSYIISLKFHKEFKLS